MMRFSRPRHNFIFRGMLSVEILETLQKELLIALFDVRKTMLCLYKSMTGTVRAQTSIECSRLPCHLSRFGGSSATRTHLLEKKDILPSLLRGPGLTEEFPAREGFHTLSVTPKG